MNRSEPNMESWLDQPHVRDWITAEHATVVDRGVSASFVAYLGTLPWIGPHLNWELLGGSRLSLEGDPDVFAWARQRRIGQHHDALIVHSPDQPGIAGSLVAILESIDILTWKTPGAHYLCGCDSINPITPVFEDFVEYDGTHFLIGQ
jgi:hypothetical protein